MYKEIIIRNGKIKHDGLIRPFNLANGDVRDFITKLDYWYLRYPEYVASDKNYENANIPNQCYCFYSFIALKQKLPTLTEFVQFYFKQYAKQLDSEYFMFRPKYWTGQQEHGKGIVVENKFPIYALVGRLARAYPTFLREIDVYTRFQDMGYDVQYSFDDDAKGIDLKIFGQNQTICVKEFIATKNSLAKLAEKEYRKINNFKQKVCMLPLFMDSKFGVPNFIRLNKIYLYDDASLEEIIKQL